MNIADMAQQNKIASDFPIWSVSSLMRLILDAVALLKTHISTPADPMCHIERLKLHAFMPVDAELCLEISFSGKSHARSCTFVLMDHHKSRNNYVSGAVFLSETYDEQLRGDFARYERLLNTCQMEDLLDIARVDDYIRGKSAYRMLAHFCKFSFSFPVVTDVFARPGEVGGLLVFTAHDPFQTIDNLNQLPFIFFNLIQAVTEHENFFPTSLGQTVISDACYRYLDKISTWRVYMNLFDTDSTAKICDLFAFDAHSNKLCIIMKDVAYSSMPRQINKGIAAVEAHQHQLVNGYGSMTKDVLVWNDSATSPLPHAVDGETEQTTTKSMNMIQQKATNDDIEQLEASTISVTILADIFCRIADVDAAVVGNETSIIELGIDSLMVMELIKEISQITSAELSVKEVMGAATMSSLIDLISAKTASESR